jgi:deoxyadenosine/deoxycytidine kinase
MSIKVVVISGAIGVGKTTLMKLIKDRLAGDAGEAVSFLHEPVEEWERDGILGKFYSDRKRFALSFQLHIYTSCIKQFEEFTAAAACVENSHDATAGGGAASGIVFIERYIYDQLLFWQRQGDMVDPLENDAYMNIWHLWRRFVPEPSAYILLTTDDPELACQRVEERGRRDELKVSRDESFVAYQRELRRDHLRFFAEGRAHPPHCTVAEGIPCMHINTSDLPYHNSEESRHKVISAVEEFLKENKLWSTKK